MLNNILSWLPLISLIYFVLGLISPKVAMFWSSNPNRIKTSLISVSPFIVLCAVYFVNRYVKTVDQNNDRITDSVVNITLLDKGFRKSDPLNMEFQDELTFKFEIKNVGDKPIRGVKGGVQFYNIFDDELYNLLFVCDEVVEPNQVIVYNTMTDYDHFSSRSKSLRSYDFKDLKIKFVPIKIIFTDGSKLDYSSY